MNYSLQNFAGVPLHMDRLAVSSRLAAMKSGISHKPEPKSDSLEEWLAKRLAHLDLEYDPASGIASFRIRGMMWLGASMLEEYCWDIYDTRRIARNLQEAERIQGIKGLVIRVDSPGGLARGVDSAARAVVDFQARTGIDVRGFVENIGASAAYYSIAGCAGVHAVPDALVGSIGTMAVAVDSSRMFEEYGYDLTLYTGGAPLKGMGSTGIKWSEEWHAKLSGDVQTLRGEFTGFVKAVRPGIGEDSFKGDAFEARKAPKGMVDRLFPDYGAFLSEYADAIA